MFYKSYDLEPDNIIEALKKDEQSLMTLTNQPSEPHKKWIAYFEGDDFYLSLVYIINKYARACYAREIYLRQVDPNKVIERSLWENEHAQCDQIEDFIEEHLPGFESWVLTYAIKVLAREVAKSEDK